MKISIHPDHDPKALGAGLKAHGRLQIPNFFPADVADHLYGLLQNNQTWFVAYNNQNKFYEVPHAEVAALPPAQRQKLGQQIARGAHEGFQYFFQQYYISDAVNHGREPGHALHDMHHYVNSAPFLDFMRTLTGDSSVRVADSFASRYLPGHFLTQHDDTHETDDRITAYVISMTKDWKADWGGNLLFYDADGNIEGGFKPTFNTLNIFMVPRPHAVSHVAPFAGGARTSFLGWLKR